MVRAPNATDVGEEMIPMLTRDAFEAYDRCYVCCTVFEVDQRPGSILRACTDCRYPFGTSPGDRIAGCFPIPLREWGVPWA
jgi:hypothetical protein